MRVLGLFAFIGENLTAENIHSIGKVILVQKSFAKVLGIAVIESSSSDIRLVTVNDNVLGEIVVSASVKRKRLPLDLR